MSNQDSPVLRTLSPALRGLERGVRAWLDGERRHPLTAIGRATLEGIANDLKRQADSLDMEAPLLVVMLMGVTGVGKSTLFNALAGGTLAAASIQRPTTKDPVVYYHESVRPDRLDPLLRHCRLVPHDRADLAQKVIVDTPDVDSTNLANRETLMRVLPVADVVLYVGSQEKYHDSLIWDQFLKQRKRRAFAFVVNKWDRCRHEGAAGLRPDQDLMKDLEAKGFKSPKLFRTCAQIWVDRATGQPADPLPEGEQFQELSAWLDAGLGRLEIEAIKARGVSQLLRAAAEAVKELAPPDLASQAKAASEAWRKPLDEEAATTADILLNSLEPYQREIEHHFALQGKSRFKGIMSLYLGMVTRMSYAGSVLPSRLSFTSKGKATDVPASWDLGMFTRACTDAASGRQLDARGKALADRLLVEADAQGFPVPLLAGPVEAMAALDWRTRWGRALAESLDAVEKEWTNPAGPKKAVQSLVIFLADWLPPLTLLAGMGVFLWRYFAPGGDAGRVASIYEVFYPFAALLAVLLVMHLVITLVLPLRWSSIREQFHKRLEERVRQELEDAYSGVPADVAAKLLAERKQAEKLGGEVAEVASWLAKREQAASIAGLYGQDEHG
ncbi:MAG: GTPase domain-containing protein [Gemmataceae bacterium]|nr:GTPase domain-containing protein [Gemmataceae bacterium]